MHIQWPTPALLGAAIRGHIVLVASTAAQRGEAFHADYAASKGALTVADQEPVERAGAAGDPVQLRRSGLGADGDVGWNP